MKLISLISIIFVFSSLVACEWGSDDGNERKKDEQKSETGAATGDEQQEEGVCVEGPDTESVVCPEGSQPICITVGGNQIPHCQRGDGKVLPADGGAAADQSTVTMGNIKSSAICKGGGGSPSCVRTVEGTLVVSCGNLVCPEPEEEAEAPASTTTTQAEEGEGNTQQAN